MQPRLTIDIDPELLLRAACGRLSPPVELGFLTALSVRTAFDALLSELGLAPGSEVVMSALTIAGMPDIVRAHGLIPVALDIDLDTLCVSPDELATTIGARTGLVVVAQLFGARPSLDAVSSLCRARGVPLVEDAAQAFDGSVTLGSGADVSLFSFGPIKTMTCLGGAAIVCRDPGFEARLAARLSKLPPLPEIAFRRRAAKYLGLKLLETKTGFGVMHRAISASGRDPDAVIGGVARGFSGSDMLRAVRHAPPHGMLALLAHRMATPFDVRERSRRGDLLTARLAGAVERPGSRAERRTHWLAPVLVADPRRLITTLTRAGFDATRGATSLRALGRAPQATRLIEDVVYLPWGRHMSSQALETLIETVLSASQQAIIGRRSDIAARREL